MAEYEVDRELLEKIADKNRTRSQNSQLIQKHLKFNQFSIKLN